MRRTWAAADNQLDKVAGLTTAQRRSPRRSALGARPVPRKEPDRPMTIVDAHHHLWDLSVRDQPWLAQPELAPLRRNFTLGDLEPEAAAQGVTATVLVQTVAEAEETPEMLALAA